jgi:hypothetical protein
MDIEQSERVGDRATFAGDSVEPLSGHPQPATAVVSGGPETAAGRASKATVSAPNHSSPWWTWLAPQYLLPAASLTGLLIYGLVRQLYAIFYGRLGATPEDVGLGYSEILSLSAAGVCWIVAFELVVGAVAWGWYETQQRLVGILGRLPLTQIGVGIVGSVVSVGLGMLALAVELGARFPELSVSRVLFVAICVAAIVGLWVLTKVAEQAVSTLPRTTRVLGTAGVLALGALVVGGAVLVTRTNNEAAQAFVGQEATPIELFGVQVLDLRAEPTLVAWVSGDPPQAWKLLDNTCMLYLGDANGKVVLFAPASKLVDTIRVPSSSVTAMRLRISSCSRRH